MKAFSESKEKDSLEDQIMSTNPILEAFGNSATVRNENSSRFGKYLNLMIDKRSKQIIGAQTKYYLLEKSRLTSLQKEERNFHIFYFILEGMGKN